MSRQRRIKGATLACCIALSLALQIKGASAFSPEPVAPPSAGVQANPQSQLAQPGIPQAPQFDLYEAPAAGKSNGTEITIPGIGSLGSIPKLDFGLELLYGPKNGPEALQLDQHAPDGDMQIKGTLTHRF